MMKKSSCRWEGSEKEQGIDALLGYPYTPKSIIQNVLMGERRDTDRQQRPWITNSSKIRKFIKRGG